MNPQKPLSGNIARWLWDRLWEKSDRCSQCDAPLPQDDPLEGVCSATCADARFLGTQW